MSFSYRLNTEFIYYQQSIAFLKKAFMTYSEVERDLYYGSEEERKERLYLPTTRDGVSYAILAIICMACCVESILNLALTEHLRKQSSAEDDSDTEILKKNIHEKKLKINSIYSNIISRSLNNRLTLLSNSRNKLVHSKEYKMFSGGTVFPDDYILLEKKNLLRFFAAVKKTAILFAPIIGIDVRCANSPLMGDGDISFDEVIPFHRKTYYVLKHPLWYIFKRIPLKIKTSILLSYKRRAINKLFQNH